MPGTSVSSKVAQHSVMLAFLTGMRDRCLTSAGLAIGTSATTAIKIVNTVTYILDAIFRSKTTAEVAFTATTMDITNSTTTVQEACYLISLNSSGTPTLTKGTTATGAGTAVVPATPAATIAIGYVRIAVAAGATPFDASSDALNAGHLTVTYVNLSVNASDWDLL